MTEKTKRGISALALRSLACFCMLCDHVGYFLVGRYPGLYFLRIIGRIAFPIYVFLLVNGFRYTHNKLIYALRLAVFAVISQLPFALVFHPKQFPGSGSVFVTLFLSLLCAWSVDVLRKWKWSRLFALLPSILVCGLYFFGYIRSDYGYKGILLALSFYFFDGKKLLTILGTFVSLFAPTLIGYAFQVYYFISSRPYAFKLPDKWGRTEAYALLALIPIFFYHGKKGHFPKNRFAAKALQYSFYLFYPVHLTVLYFIFRR